MIRTALYTGSFDPLTNGHLDIIRSAAALCDRLIVGIGANPVKVPLFSAEDRAAMIRACCAQDAAQEQCELDVRIFDGLAVEAARRFGAKAMVRGLRDGGDLDYELQMAGMNNVLVPDVHTIFLPSSPGVRHITATLVRQIAALKGNVAPFVPAPVAIALQQKFAGAGNAAAS